MQTLSMVLGILALVGMVVGFFPCLGWMNWVNIPFALVGLVVSIVALSRAEEGKKTGAMVGLVCCGLAIGLGIVRLLLGGGVF